MPPTDASATHAEETAPIRRGWFLAAAGVLAVTALATTFTRVYNYDIFWHLASGDWMLRNLRVLGTDPFSVDPQPEWVNVHWLFQVIVSALYGLGGFGLLCVMKTALAVGAVIVFALALRRGVPAFWLVACGTAATVVMAARIRVRPEAFTMFFLVVALAVVESVRRGAPRRRLWLLVPVMLLWANLHGLYFLGPALLWSGALGAAIDRRFRPALAGGLAPRRYLAACLCATLVCLATPWPLRAAAQPLLLWTRVSGQTVYYTYGVSEFLPTWRALHLHVVGAGLVVAAAAACLLNARRVPAAHLLWLAAFAALGILARRNVALTGPVCGYLLAVHGAAVLRRLRAGRSLRRKAAWANVLAMGVAAAVCGIYATEWLYRVKGIPRRFGPGLERELYPIDTAARLGRLDAAGEIYCDNWGDAGTFIYFSRPRRLWMDGRLEAHSLERFVRQCEIRQALRDPRSAAEFEPHPDLRFFFVRFTEREQLPVLSHSKRFRLLFVEPLGACFARTDWLARSAPGGRRGSLPPRANLDEYDLPLGRDLRVAALAAPARQWWRQNPQSRAYRLGSLLLWLGWESPNVRAASIDPRRARCTLLAVRHLTAARAEGILPADVAAGMLAQAHQQRALQDDVVCSPTVPVDMNSARALWLYRRLDLTRLSDENLRRFAEQHVDALVRARQLDAAERAAAALLARPAPDDDARKTHRALHERIATTVRLRRKRAEAIDAPLPHRAYDLTAPEVGLIDQAVAELRAAAPTPGSRLVLGDLLLRRGEAAAARRAYGQARGPAGRSAPAATDEPIIGTAPRPWQLRLRLALCAWVEGRLFEAGDALKQLSQGPGRPAAAYYHALLREQIGQYDEALEAIRGLQPADEQLADLVGRLRRRLLTR